VDPSRPSFDDRLAATYVGKYILVGVTYLDPAGEAIRREQVHGVVEEVTREGLRVSLRGERDGETWWLPPDLSAVRVAPAGVYSLYSTGEDVENPDLLSTWRVCEEVTVH
jgi:hypothetical protein